MSNFKIVIRLLRVMTLGLKLKVNKHILMILPCLA